jgi:hypothetical protein
MGQVQMARRRGPRDYLYKRSGPDNWWIKFQYPDTIQQAATLVLGRIAKKEEAVSLGTPCRKTAEVNAQPLILRHKQILIVHAALADRHRKWGNIVVRPLMAPTDTKVMNPDGSSVIATATDVVHIGTDGNIRIEPNLEGVDIEIDEERLTKEQKREIADLEDRLLKANHKDVDFEVVEAYINDRKKRGKFERNDDPTSLRRTLEEFRAINGGRPSVSQAPKMWRRL